MRKIYILTTLAACLLSSCGNFLEEKKYGLVIPSTYPESLAALESCVNALYRFAGTMYNESAVWAFTAGGDDLTTIPGGNKAGYLQYDIFTVADNNDRNVLLWERAYQTIKQANVISLAMPNIVQPGTADAVIQDQKDRALGQALFMRALAYYNLVRIWGEVPMSVDEIGINYDKPKSSFADIYARIEEDLKKAETLLPVNYTDAPNTTSVERSTAYAKVTSGAAKSLLASVYLTWAGYPMKDPSKYALAAQKAKEVIDNEADYGYVLLPDCYDLWKWQNGWKSTGNAEGVFTFFYNTRNEANMSSPSAMFPEDFGGWNDMFAELTFFEEFPEGPRKDATFLTTAKRSPDGPVITWNGDVEAGLGFIQQHPYYRKMIEIEGFDYDDMDKNINWTSSRSCQLIRYAEVLLIYAEAQPMADGSPNALAYTCLNRVRTRAGLEDAPAGLSGSDFRNVVIDERKWEFAGGEPGCSRWHDLVRTETVAASLAKRHPNEVPVVGRPDDATHSLYFSPIPSKDVLLNPNL
jgi:hypothetical protein